jgi:hypothetical protein
LRDDAPDRQRISSLDCPAHAQARPLAPTNQKRGDVSAPGVANSNWLRVFAAPLYLAAASGVGFVTAFLWGDIGRYLCWLGVGLALIVIAWLAVFRAVPR